MFKCVRDLFKYKKPSSRWRVYNIFFFPSRFCKVNEYNHHNMYYTKKIPFEINKLVEFKV